MWEIRLFKVCNDIYMYNPEDTPHGSRASTILSSCLRSLIREMHPGVHRIGKDLCLKALLFDFGEGVQ